MNTVESPMDSYTRHVTNQPVDSSAKVAKNKLDAKGPLTANPGDRIAEWSQTVEEKSKQLAVDAPDITGDHIKVPTYFIVEDSHGEKRALHHVKDAKELSDVIRQVQFEQTKWVQRPLQAKQRNFNVSILVFVLALFLVTVPILIGIF